jgi:hypothetical protein
MFLKAGRTPASQDKAKRQQKAVRQENVRKVKLKRALVCCQQSTPVSREQDVEISG